MNRNEARNIVLTGGTSGIGLALAERLSQRHRLLVTARRMSDGLNALIDARPDVSFASIDQSEPALAARQILEAIEDRGWKHVDNAILNAGTGWTGDPGEERADRIRNTLDVNLACTIALSHSLHPFLFAKAGCLTLIGSTAKGGAPAFATYAASKAGLHGFARALREEWRGHIDVQMLHLGPVKTDMHAKAGFDPGWLRNLFLSAPDAAAMIEKAVARRRPFLTLNQFRFWNGAGMLGRNL